MELCKLIELFLFSLFQFFKHLDLIQNIMKNRVDVFTTFQNDEDELDNSSEEAETCVFTIECCFRQGFPLRCMDDNSFSESFSEIPLVVEGISNSLLVDYELGTNRILFHEPLYKGPFYYGMLRKSFSPGCHKKNGIYRKSIKDTIEGLDFKTNPKVSSLQNEVFAWGDNSAEFLVSTITIQNIESPIG